MATYLLILFHSNIKFLGDFTAYIMHWRLFLHLSSILLVCAGSLKTDTNVEVKVTIRVFLEPFKTLNSNSFTAAALGAHMQSSKERAKVMIVSRQTGQLTLPAYNN